MDTELTQLSYALTDGSLYYTEQGQGDCILLIHGSLCDYRYWRWQLQALAENNMVIAASLRRCWPEVGEHPNAQYSVSQHSQDLTSFLRGQNKKAHIVGHSRGASVATMMALEAPDVCSSITLADPGFKIDNQPTGDILYSYAVEMLQNNEIDTALEYFVDHVNGTDTWSKMVYWFKDMARDNAKTLLSQINESDFSLYSDAIAAIECPILLINGKNSPIKYQRTCDQIQKLQPDATRKQIALAAHGMNLANPRTFNRVVLEFINSI